VLFSSQIIYKPGSVPLAGRRSSI